MQGEEAEAIALVEDAPSLLSPLTLRFHQQRYEKEYRQYQDTTRFRVDRAGAWCYLLMDLPGLLTILAAATFMPALWTSSLQGCTCMTLTTTAVLATHLLLLLALPAPTYGLLRRRIVTAVRVLYMCSAAFKGLQQCSTATRWVAGVELESPVSALLWRTGIIALLWHGSAFQLPWWEHLFLQSVTSMTYALFLADSVCTSLDTVEHGHTALATAHAALQWLRYACWHLPGFLVTGHPHFLRALASTGAGAGTGSAQPGGPVLQEAACVWTVQCCQLLLGHVLPSTVLYFREATDRRRWWEKHYGTDTLQQQQPQQPPVQEPEQQQPQTQRQQEGVPRRCMSLTWLMQSLASYLAGFC